MLKVCKDLGPIGMNSMVYSYSKLKLYPNKTRGKASISRALGHHEKEELVQKMKQRRYAD